MLFTDFANQFETTILPLHKPASVVTIKSHLKQFRKVFAGKPLALPYQDVQQYITAASTTYAVKTVKNLWGSLHLVLEQARREGLIADVPEPVLPKPRLQQELEWLTLEQMKNLIHIAPEPHQTFYALLAETGLRVGESLGLQPQDIDFTNHTLRVRRSVFNGKPQTPKTPNAYRVLSISGWLGGLLRGQCVGLGPEGFVFRTSKGSPWWPNDTLEVMGRHLTAAGIKPVGFHALRRGNITLCAKILGMPESILAQRVGHKPQGLTLGLYCQDVELADKGWPERIEEVLR